SALCRPDSPRHVAAALAATLVLASQVLAVAPVAAHARPASVASSPVQTAARDPAPPGDVAAGVGDLQPGVPYEQAIAHAGDRIKSRPGGRVTVPFRPRAGDGWSVAGKAPRALPAGTATGRELIPTVTTAPEPAATPVPAAPAPSDAPVDA